MNIQTQNSWDIVRLHLESCSFILILCFYVHSLVLKPQTKESEKLLRAAELLLILSAAAVIWFIVKLQIRISGALRSTWTFSSSENITGYRLDFQYQAFFLEWQWLQKWPRLLTCEEPGRSGLFCVIELTWNMRVRCYVGDGGGGGGGSVKGYIKVFCIPENESENQSLLFETTTMEEKVTYFIIMKPGCFWLSALGWAKSQFYTDII